LVWWSGAAMNLELFDFVEEEREVGLQLARFAEVLAQRRAQLSCDTREGIKKLAPRCSLVRTDMVAPATSPSLQAGQLASGHLSHFACSRYARPCRLLGGCPLHKGFSIEHSASVHTLQSASLCEAIDCTWARGGGRENRPSFADLHQWQLIPEAKALPDPATLLHLESVHPRKPLWTPSRLRALLLPPRLPWPGFV